MPKTLLLDRDVWDLVLDAAGDIACASEPYSVAQNVASALRTFAGECWYGKQKGMPYWQQILGHYPPMALVRDRITSEAMKEQDVAQVRVQSLDATGRTLTGEVLVIDTNGQQSGVTF